MKIDNSKRSEILIEYGLAEDYDFQSFDNIITSCSTCNSKKNKNLLPKGSAAINIARAIKVRPKIENLIQKFIKNNELDRIKFALGAAIEKGTLTPEELPQLLSSIENKRGEFKLSSPIFGDGSVMELSKKNYEEYLNSNLQLPDWLPNGLRLLNEQNEIFVRTLQEYEVATKEGYYAYSNAEMKAAYAYFRRPLSVLKLLLRAQPAEKSYIDEPKRGLADINLLPASLLFSSYPLSGDPTEIDNSLQSKSIGDLVESGKASIKKLSSNLIYIEHDHTWTFMFEVMRADVNSDGIQDLIINWGGGPSQGTLSVGEIKVLVRKNPEENFVEINLTCTS